MLCHGKPLCGKRAKNGTLSDGNDSEGEDMYGFLPKEKTIAACVRRENIYESAPRKAAKPKAVTFVNEPPRVKLIQRRHSCADNFGGYAAARFNYQPLIPVERLPSYPNSVRRSASSVGASVCGHYQRRQQLPPPSPVRPPPPCYLVAVRRAASFSASRGVNRGLLLRRPPPPTATVSRAAAERASPLNRTVSSSTSDLYVDSFALKRVQSQDLSAASSTSSISEATVYRKIGPCDYVSVSEKPQRKSFGSQESSSDDGVDVSFRSSLGSSTVCDFRFFVLEGLIEIGDRIWVFSEPEEFYRPRGEPNLLPGGRLRGPARNAALIEIKVNGLSSRTHRRTRPRPR